MSVLKAGFISVIFLTVPAGYALEPDEILVIVNSDAPASIRTGQYYCTMRKVPKANVLGLPLGAGPGDTIGREDYESKLAAPIREKLSTPEFAEKIRCLLTTYGVPVKVGGRGPLKGKEDELKRLRELAEQQRNALEQLKQSGSAGSSEQKRIFTEKLARLQSDIDRIVGKETNASVDSELSMVMFGEYELYRWQPNQLKNNVLGLSLNTLMVCRLDGPDEKTAQGLVDKAMAAEKTTLKGVACIDSRGIADDKQPFSPGHYDQSLRDLALLTKFRTALTVKEERTEGLFPAGACPNTAVYCGWYSLQKYIDAFDFVDGAVGYHISSLEAADLRDPNSSQWCPAMLRDGIAATLGAVAEPYLLSFPEPKAFFLELFKGRRLVEAYYYTAPFNSWQLVLIGDPLYRPFKITP
ncbi:MAG TPA: TIGR03790 family protein [Sedimentisphaerales bacterium]|nr:TIGR03790 family protein [Sedimentisphaerales bacterium]